MPHGQTSGQAPLGQASGQAPLDSAGPSSENGPDSAVSTVASSPENSSHAIRRSQRQHRPPGYLNQFICYSANIKNPISALTSDHEEFSGTSYPLHHYVTCVNFSPSHQRFLAAIMKVDEPKFYHTVVQDVHWRKAMNEEIEALDKNGTCDIIDLPTGKHPIGCKWVYRVKYNSDGSIQRYKA